MVPEFWIVMDDREPPNARVGEEMAALRRAIIKAITHDAGLATILGANGDIRYVGATSDMAIGREMLGQMNIRFRLTYPLLPDEL
jgi:hypothetical protein